MLVARMEEVSCHYGTQAVLAGASFKLSAGQRVGLIGNNGAGKTTLIRLLLGEEKVTTGAITLARSIKVGYVPQHVEFSTGETTIECVLANYRRLSEELRRAEDKLSKTTETDYERVLAEFQKVRDNYDALDGDLLPQRAAAMLDSLGLADRTEQPVEQLSGGEKAVVSLARALLAEPDLLILDEPGNHLDHHGLDWLIDFLNQFKGAIFLVSHNRYLLDRVVDGILELDAGLLTYYDGGYTAYRSTKLQNSLAQQADYVANQKRLAQLEELVKRFAQIASVNSDKAWGRRLRARRSQLDREKSQAVEKPILDRPAIRAQFTGQGSRAQIAMQIRGYTKAFGDNVLLEDAELDIACGERVALVGPNGCGKTTLLRDIIRDGAWDSDRIRIGPSLTVGYGSQEKEVGSGDTTLLEEIRATVPMTDGQAFSLLAKLNFTQEDMNKRIDELSGGERNRLQLAKLMVTKPNFLILDEPTNHLDILSREAMEEALQEFEGTLLVVSHDRYFLEKVAGRVVELRGQKLQSFIGTFGEYWQLRKAGPARSKARTSKRRQERETKSTTRKSGNQGRVLVDLEAKIAQAESEKEDLERRVVAAFGSNDVALGQQLQTKLRRQQSQIDDMYRRWESAVE